ncbi:TATA-box-binding protein [Halococcus salsus]|uniref:TATA-box-binding protein n=1 Tax=Halococcus salsus TaxID=2162894 RepID=UPI00135AAFA2|nr:TATA-box-binding protein [Halococcus salsus]
MAENPDIEPYIEALEIQNVVASSAIGQEIDLEALAMDLEGVDFDPEEFPGLIYRIEEPHATALIFRSGKIVCTGANSVDGVHEALASVFETLRDLSLRVDDDPTITVQNIVVSGDLGERLNLNAIAIGFGLEAVEYEPEQFPALVYRLEDPAVAALLFGSGKTIITGCKQLEDAEEATDVLVERLSDLSLLG